jgi:RND family efflux transporter MFP subunit
VTLSRQARQAIDLQTEEVALADVSAALSVYAETVATWQGRAFGSAQVSGRVVKLLVRPGESVSKNQVVAELSSRELESLRQDYLQATRELKLNTELIELTRPSAESGAIPMQRLLELETAYQQSLNSLEIARIRSQIFGIPESDLKKDETLPLHHFIRSPIAGKVIHSDLAEGQYVEAFEHLFEIVNNDQLWVRVQLLEKDSFKVKPGQPVSIEFSDAKIKIDTTVEWIDAALDPKTRVCWAWAVVSHPNALPGLAGKATIQISTDSSKLTVPLNAILSDGLQSYVFVEEAATRESAEYRKRNLKLGERRQKDPRTLDHRIEVLQGDIYPGDRIVMKGGHELSSLFFLGVLKLSEVERQRLGISTATVSEKKLKSMLELPAIVSLPPESRSIVSSQLEGTICSHTLSPGREVKKGELLLEIAAPEFCSLQVELLTKILNANLARQRVERLSNLKADALSRRIVMEIRAEAERLEGQAENLKRQLLILGLTPSEMDQMIRSKNILRFLPVRSTINGKISNGSGTIGETVIANQRLAEIQNTTSFWFETHLPVQQLKNVQQADRGIVSALSKPDYRIPITVARLSPVVNESTRTSRIWLSPLALPPENLFKEGMFLTAFIFLQEGPQGLAVPSSAVIRDGLQHFVFIQKPNDYIERRRVIIGRSDDEFVEILSGVSVGESVISSGGRELQTAHASLR